MSSQDIDVTSRGKILLQIAEMANCEVLGTVDENLPTFIKLNIVLLLFSA